MTASAMTGDKEKCLAAGMDDYLSKPVRPEDVRIIVDRWGASASTAMKPATPAPVTPAPAAQPAANAEPPVDMDRLNDFTEGNPENLRELVTLYVKQTTQQVEDLRVAVAARNAPEVRRVAHSCAGASATCGVAKFAGLLRELELLGHENRLAGAPQLFADIAAEFDRVRTFLAPHVAPPAELAAKA